MDAKTFNRYEEKFLLREDQKNRLLKYLPRYCSWDPFCGDRSVYTVYNLYYDTPDGQLIRESVERPRYKEKLRFRSYVLPVCDEDPVYVEIKKKVDGRVIKRRVRLPYRQACQWVENGKIPQLDDYVDRQVAAEIGYFLQVHPLIPHTFISYERLAMSAKDESGIRLTFDSQIRERCENPDFFHEGGTLLLPSGCCLMEIKTSQNFPLWLITPLSEMGLFSRSFSKVGYAHLVKIRGEQPI
jgi:hypothetical protein